MLRSEESQANESRKSVAKLNEELWRNGQKALEEL